MMAQLSVFSKVEDGGGIAWSGKSFAGIAIWKSRVQLLPNRILLCYTGFPLSSKTNTSKFQFDLECTDTVKTSSYELLSASSVKKQFNLFTPTK